MKRYSVMPLVIFLAIFTSACTTSSTSKEPSAAKAEISTSTTFENGPNIGERAAGEYLGFDITTFRHDPTYYDEVDEYIEIVWLGPGQVDLEGYKIIGTSADLYEYTYTFPKVVLNEGEIVTVFTQPGPNRLSFGYNGEIWADDESEIRLYDPNDYLEAYYGE